MKRRINSTLGSTLVILALVFVVPACASVVESPETSESPAPSAATEDAAFEARFDLETGSGADGAIVARARDKASREIVAEANADHGGRAIVWRRAGGHGGTVTSEHASKSGVSAVVKAAAVDAEALGGGASSNPRDGYGCSTYIIENSAGCLCVGTTCERIARMDCYGSCI